MNPLEGFAPVRATIACDTGEHSIKWVAGGLELEDHDVGSERALVALGGEPPLCLDVLDAWQYAVTTNPHGWISTAVMPRAGERTSLVALRAQVMRNLRSAAVMFRQGQSQLPQHVYARMRAQAHGQQVWRSQLMANLPDELRAPLVATCVYEVERRWHEEPSEIARRSEFAFDDVVEAKAGWAMRESLASWAPPGGLVRIPIHLQFKLLTPEERPSILVELLGTTALVDVGLPLRWLADVWARGCMLVDGCFVLDVTEARNDGTTLRARAVRWERSRRAFVPVVAHAIIARADDEWGLAWTGDGIES